MVNNPFLVAVPASVMLWAVGVSAGGVGGSRAVAERADGRDAERLIVEAMLDAFDDGLDLVSVTERRGGGAAGRLVVELDLAEVAARRECCQDGQGCEPRGEARRTILAMLDAAGRVTHVEVRSSPGGDAWQVYQSKSELLASLRAGRVVHSLALEPLGDRGARLVGTMRGGRRFLVYLGDFMPVEPPCAC